MAVAALSTASILTTASPAPAQTPATGETSENFANLVARAKPDDKAAAEQGKAETGEEAPADGEVAQDDAAQTNANAEQPAIPIDQPADLLAKIQAMATAAAQLFTPQPATPAAPVLMLSSTEATGEAGTTAATATPTLLFPAAKTPVLGPATAKLSDATTTAQQAEAGAEPVKPLAARSDIAALIASLKSAFEPGAKPAAAAIAAPVPTSPVPATPDAAPVATPATPELAEATAQPAQAQAAVVANLNVAALIKPVTADPAKPAPVDDGTDQDDNGLALSGTVSTDSTAPVAPVATTSPTTPSAPVAATTAPTQPVTAPTDTAAVADMSAAGKAEQAIDRHIDLVRDHQWLDRLARDISQAANTQGSLKFHMNPEHLGSLAIEIANSASGATIKFTTETDQARAIIADAQPRLLAEVRAQGLRVSESHVDLNQQQDGGSNSNPATGQGQAQHQNRHASEDHKPFARTHASIRDDAGDSASRDDGELYA